jgi:hypothetical protein
MRLKFLYRQKITEEKGGGGKMLLASVPSFFLSHPQRINQWTKEENRQEWH